MYVIIIESLFWLWKIYQSKPSHNHVNLVMRQKNQAKYARSLRSEIIQWRLPISRRGWAQTRCSMVRRIMSDGQYDFVTSPITHFLDHLAAGVHPSLPRNLDVVIKIALGKVKKWQLPLFRGAAEDEISATVLSLLLKPEPLLGTTHFIDCSGRRRLRRD